MAAGGRGPALSEVSSAQGEEALRSDSDSDEPVLPASITAGEIPLEILLSDPELSTQDVSIGLQETAELIPIEDSPLALLATLWTVPSDTQAEPTEESDPSGEREESVPSSASPPPWAAFVIGLEEAFERSRDACGKILSDGARNVEGEEAGDAAGERLEWRCPIIPTASGRGQWDQVKGWTASGSALIAGWFWARRRLRQGWGLGRSGRKDHRRSGRDHFEEGP
jgi:hypothetical protein